MFLMQHPSLPPYLSTSPPLPPPLSSQVLLDAVRQISHALHLCLLLWPARLLPPKKEEEKGETGTGEGRGGGAVEGSGDGGVTGLPTVALPSSLLPLYPLTDCDAG